MLLSSVVAKAQTDSTLFDKTGKIDVRTSDNVEKYLSDDTYNYDQKFAKPPESLIQRLIYWIYRFFLKVGEGGPVAWVFYGVLIFILIVVLAQLLGFKYDALFAKSKKNASADIEVFDEDIHSLDINQLITDAIKDGDYRRAIRYAYLKLLKVMDNNDLIEWKPDKTNRDYYREMRNGKYFHDFSQLTKTYEYVWYGEFDINREHFDYTYSVFQKVYRDLNEK